MTQKKTVWVEPERTQMIRCLRTHNRVPFPELVKAVDRTHVRVNHDVELLEKYSLIHTYTEPSPGHGTRKVIQPDFGKEKILLEAVYSSRSHISDDNL